MRQYAALLERRVQTGTRARKALVVTRQANPLGRSMIEMLGVLAIIAVLSVGGIAGYSKAMEKFKINKTIGEYNQLIMGLLEQRESIIKSIQGQSGEILLNNIALAAGIAPNSWTITGRYLDDGAGNYVYPYATNEVRMKGDVPNIVVDFNVGGLSANESGQERSENFSNKLCVEMFNNLVVPLSDFLRKALVWRAGSDNSSIYVGSQYCSSGRKCLKDMTLSDIHKVCNSCDKTAQRCNVTISF